MYWKRTEFPQSFLLWNTTWSCDRLYLNKLWNFAWDRFRLYPSASFFSLSDPIFSVHQSLLWIERHYHNTASLRTLFNIHTSSLLYFYVIFTNCPSNTDVWRLTLFVLQIPKLLELLSLQSLAIMWQSTLWIIMNKVTRTQKTL